MSLDDQILNSFRDELSMYRTAFERASHMNAVEQLNNLLSTEIQPLIEGAEKRLAHIETILEELVELRKNG